eukprot:TRINITY_DN3418_c0_g1_i1.p1 TRINITY_DN3418_c0_g1~~TRINITY_DN3418_c0_g1_i1.p1  ORF type:complete len:180 (-),score=27.88 TRINITY_DN3418_c0_g1_i1:193-702(-)
MSSKEGVTILVHGEAWICCSTLIKDLQSQSVMREDEQFPHENLQRWFNQKKKIVQIAYGDNTYIILAHRFTYNIDIGNQNLSVSQEFPSEFIQEAWTNNCQVNVLSYCKNEWIVVTEQTDQHVPQGVKLCADLDELQDSVAQAWKDKKKVLQVTWSPEGWALLTEQVLL